MKRANKRRVNRRIEPRRGFAKHLRPLFNIGLKFLCVVGIVGMGVFLYEVRDHFEMDERLLLKTVEVSGHYRAANEEILLYSGLEQGMSLLDVDLEGVANAVRAHPWVKHVTVRRQLVDKISIKVWEHQPAFLASIDKVYVVSEEHLIFKQMTARDVLDLPVVSGLTERSPKSYFAAANELLKELDRFRDSLGEVAEIRFDETLGWSVVFGSSLDSRGFIAHLGKHPNRELVLTKMLIEALNKQGVEPAEVWLGSGSDADRIPLRVRSHSKKIISNSMIAEAG